MARLAFISSFPLLPASGGNRVRVLTMMRTLEAQGHETHFILMPSRQMGSFDEAAHREQFGERFHLLERPVAGEALYLVERGAAKLRRVLMRSRLRLSSVDETYFNGFTPQITALDAKCHFDAVIVQYVGFSRALEAFGRRTMKMIDTHDSFVGQMPAEEERRGLLRADRVIAIQEQEAQVFRRLLQTEAGRVVTVSHLIDGGDAIPTGECGGAAFIGSDFEQNNVSLTWFIREVLPRIRARVPDFVLSVAGSVGRAVPDADGVRKLGFVDEVRDAFRAAPILVNCITRGTGVKIKLLEAFGAGVPVVSTALGVEGIPERHLGGTLVCPDGDAEAFADATLALFRDAAARARLAAENLAIARAWNAEQVEALRGLVPAAA